MGSVCIFLSYMNSQIKLNCIIYIKDKINKDADAFVWGVKKVSRRKKKKKKELEDLFQSFFSP